MTAEEAEEKKNLCGAKKEDEKRNEMEKCEEPTAGTMDGAEGYGHDRTCLIDNLEPSKPVKSAS